MRLILMCKECGTWSEWGGDSRYEEVQSYEINNTDFKIDISASIGGVDDVQEMQFDESDLSIDDKKVELKCRGCNASLTINE